MQSNKTATQATQKERRTGSDRRNWTCEHSFPYIAGHGEMVTEDRRKSGDRRVESELPKAHQNG